MARLARTPRKWWPIGGGGGGGGDRPSWLTSWVTAALLGSLLVDLAHRQGMMPALQPGAAATAACHTQPAQPAVAAATAATGSSSAGPGGLPSAVPSYNFTLEARTLDRGVVMQGDSARTRRALVKLLNGQRTTVVFVGGSASWGTGVKDRSLSFASRTLAWVNASFPARPPGGGHAVLNGARYAATSTYFATCTQRHVPPDADLVFLELNLNDAEGGDHGETPIRRAHERLIRRLLALPNRPAVVELTLYRHPYLPLRPDNRVPFRCPDDETGVFAVYYRLPWLSTRSMVWGEIGFPPEGPPDPPPPRDPPYKWEPVESMADESLPGRFTRMFADGEGHPSEDGHRWIAELVVHWMSQHLAGLTSASPLGPEDEEAAQEELPPPMFPRNWASPATACFLEDGIRDLVTANNGFDWVNEGTEEKPKWGLLSTTPGSKLRMKLNTTLEGASGNVSLVVGHLKSYEHMGQFSVACLAGCACDPRMVDGNHVHKTSQLYMAEQAVTQHCARVMPACELQVTVLETTSSSGEAPLNKVKILGLAVSQESTNAERWSPWNFQFGPAT